MNKKFLITILCIIIVQSSNAQLKIKLEDNSNASNFTVNNGKIGINFPNSNNVFAIKADGVGYPLTSFENSHSHDSHGIVMDLKHTYELDAEYGENAAFLRGVENLTTRFWIGSKGTAYFSNKVGIGTSIPSYKLNVDPQGQGGILIGNPNNSTGGYTSLKLAISSISGGYSEIQSIKSSGSEWGDLLLNKWGGNVGIGTTDPKNLLDVKGTIHAQEVKVDMNNWSDFVFHPSYQLKPLTEVEKFIKANGHLQDIPSAAEVEQNGVNVGEMQKKLLQKVEELTLYVIEQEKINKRQAEEIKTLKQKLENHNK